MLPQPISPAVSHSPLEHLPTGFNHPRAHGPASGTRGLSSLMWCQLWSLTNTSSYIFVLLSKMPWKTKAKIHRCLPAHGKENIFQWLWQPIKKKATPDLCFCLSMFRCWRNFSKVFPITAQIACYSLPSSETSGLTTAGLLNTEICLINELCKKQLFEFHVY